MPDSVRVTVVMTAYNREAYIGAAIESVLAQDYTNFTLLVVDDASTDSTVVVARRYAERDARVRVVVNERNRGDYPNRNHAASLVETPYFKFHDSDDVMYPHCLSTMMRLLESEPLAGMGLSLSRAWPGGPVPMLQSPRQCYQREYLGFRMFTGGPACALFRTAVFHQLGGFPEAGPHSDHLFWLDACAQISVLLLPADLFWYRIHGGQELSSPGAARSYAQVPGAVWQALASDACPLRGQELAQARRNHAWDVAKMIWLDVRAGHWRLALYRLRHCGMTCSDWLRFLRRPHRTAVAGVPLESDGRLSVAAWPPPTPSPQKAPGP